MRILVLFIQITISSIIYSEIDENVCNLSDYVDNNSKEIDQIITKMTLEEKVGQLTQINIKEILQDGEINEEKLNYYVVEKKVGSFLNSLSDGTERIPGNLNQWHKVINKIQSKAQETRLKIPIVYGVDSVHGANFVLNATLFPQQLGLASTFNMTIVKKVGKITAKDTRAAGIHWNFSPILDIAVNKQWPRTYETFGEDPYLSSQLGKAIVLGYQGNTCNLNSNDKVAATMKHFIGYSASRSGKDVDGAWIGNRTLNDYFRPSFQKSVDIGISTAMESYSDIDGDLLVCSKRYLVDLLRNQMKFKGMLVTDLGQISKLHTIIKVAETPKKAVKMSMSLGSIDMSMVPDSANFTDYLIELVNENDISIDTINQNVKRVLTLKKQVGLLENKGLIETNIKSMESVGSENDRLLSLDSARESIIMLKNEGILPLKSNSKILLTGPTANSLMYLTGGWTFSWQGPKNDDWFFERGTTILKGIHNQTSNVKYIPSVDINGNSLPEYNIDDLINEAKNYDVIVLCLGEPNYAELEGNVNDMRLPKGQNRLLDELVERSNKPVILILSEGRPRVLSDSHKNTKSILLNLLAGPEAGQAIGEILFGKTNPSGKLPITYANHENDNTVNYYRRVNEVYDVEWEFGFGLSFTNFTYSDLMLSSKKMDSNNEIKVTIKVTNSGNIKGKESILLYLSDEYRSISPEVKKLKRFGKVDLMPGESRILEFKIVPEDLSFYNVDNIRVIEKGNFIISISTLNSTFFFDTNSNEDYIKF